VLTAINVCIELPLFLMCLLACVLYKIINNVNLQAESRFCVHRWSGRM